MQPKDSGHRCEANTGSTFDNDESLFSSSTQVTWLAKEL